MNGFLRKENQMFLIFVTLRHHFADCLIITNQFYRALPQIAPDDRILMVFEVVSEKSEGINYFRVNL